MTPTPRAHSRDPRLAPTARERPDLAPPAPLPTPIASLVGRKRDVETVVESLRREDVRLVTLTGPGGVGKSRLALAAAAEVQPSFADGVRLVRLAAIGDPELVLPTIASMLRLRDETGAAALESLQAALYDREMLLVLDNFEQIVTAGADVADLLRACPRLKALVTSRSRLRVRGEHVIPVQPLAVPERDAARDRDTLLSFPAVELFLQRGREIRPDLMQSAADVAAVAAICHRLDGLPLAIELAAARLDILPPAALLDRLQSRLPVLVDGPRDLPDRLRTMRDAIAWSFALLSEGKQRVFRRLGAFRGGFTAEAAAAVAEVPDEMAVLEALGSLTDASLLRLRSETGVDDREAPRYGMLETVREFALESLIASGEEPEIRARHADFFLALAEQLDPLLHDTGEEVWLRQLDSDHDNLRAALGWYRDTGQHEKLLRLAGALPFYWYYRGVLSEGRRWLDIALQADPDHGEPRPRAWGLMGRGLMANVSGDGEGAIAFLTESLRWWDRTDERFGKSMAGNLLAGALVRQGDYEQAIPLLEANLPYFRDVSRNWTAHGLFHLGMIGFALQDHERAAALLEEAIEVSLSYGARGDTVNPHRFLGLIACATGDRVQAAARFAEVMMLLRERGSAAWFSVGLADVATFAAACEAWAVSARLFAKGKSLAQVEIVDFSLPARSAYERAQERARAVLGDATYEAAASAGRALSLEQALAEAEAILVLSSELEAESPGRTIAADNPLTEREQDVLRLLAIGKSNPEIAEALFIGRGTVRTHVSNILGKLGAKTRTEAAALARERGMI